MITKEQIEAKAREIENAVTETKESAKDTAVLAGIGIVFAVGIAFLMGRRKGKAARTRVKVVKIR